MKRYTSTSLFDHLFFTLHVRYLLCLIPLFSSLNSRPISVILTRVVELPLLCLHPFILSGGPVCSLTIEVGNQVRLRRSLDERGPILDTTCMSCHTGTTHHLLPL